MTAEAMNPSPACRREPEDCPMFRIMRVPLTPDKFVRPLERHFHWNHFSDFRLLVVAVACMWGRRNVATLYRYLDVAHHRPRVNNFFLVARWDPAAALRQTAHELLWDLYPQPGHRGPATARGGRYPEDHARPCRRSSSRRRRPKVHRLCP